MSVHFWSHFQLHHSFIYGNLPVIFCTKSAQGSTWFLCSPCFLWPAQLDPTDWQPSCSCHGDGVSKVPVVLQFSLPKACVACQTVFYSHPAMVHIPLYINNVFFLLHASAMIFPGAVVVIPSPFLPFLHHGCFAVTLQQGPWGGWDGLTSLDAVLA